MNIQKVIASIKKAGIGYSATGSSDSGLACRKAYNDMVSVDYIAPHSRYMTMTQRRDHEVGVVVRFFQQAKEGFHITLQPITGSLMRSTPQYSVYVSDQPLNDGITNPADVINFLHAGWTGAIKGEYQNELAKINKALDALLAEQNKLLAEQTRLTNLINDVK